MDQVVVENKAEVISSIFKRCFTIKKFAARNREQGCWPETDSALWALRAGAPQNGFGEAFISVGRRVLVDEEKFWEAVAHLQEAKNASNK